MTSAHQHLQSHLHEAIPLTRDMGLEVASYDGHELRLKAPLSPNVNVHGTGFAGSLYGLAALAGWGLLFLKLEADELEGEIVVARARINYDRPVRAGFEAVCNAPALAYADFRDVLVRRGRARIQLHVGIFSGERDAARFEGQYMVSAG